MPAKKTSLEKFGRVATTLSSVSFLSGSVCFLPQFALYSVVGVWCFILGSVLMLVTSLIQ